MRIKSVFKHSAQALAEGSLVALLVVGLMAGSVLAAKPEGSGQGKPGGGGTGTISLALMDGATEARFDLLNVLDAQRVLFEVRLELVEAKAEFEKAKVRVETLIGQRLSEL